MKFLVLALVVVASAVADVSHVVNQEHAAHLRNNQVYQPPIPIVRQSLENNGLGNYKFNYETGNGIQVTEESQLKNAGTQDEAEVSHGSYSYVGDDGVTYTVNWVADEDGFRATGAHLPQVPEEFQRAVQQNAQAEQAAQRFQQVDRNVPQQQFTTSNVPQQQFTTRNVPQQQFTNRNEPQQQFINRFVLN